MKRTLLALVVAVVAAGVSGAGRQGPPRAEYPQPQFERADWLTLNGPWQFEFDDRNTGLDQNWAAGTHAFSRTITVPFAFEARLSGIGDTSFHPWVWYRRTFSVPAAWKGRRVLLRFGAVDYHATVWVNGVKAGEHEGGHTPFSFDVTPMLTSGSNTITVRAFDPPTDRYIPRGKQYWEPQSRSIFYTRTSGIWQPVWIEATGDSSLDRVRITPSLDGTVRFEGRILRPQPDLELVARIRYRDREVATATGVAEGPRVTVAAAVTNPRWWSVASPNLYDVTFELRRAGTTLDRVASYFGFREVGVEGNRMTLNRNPIYPKLVLDQGYWPEGVLTPPTDEAIQFDIKAAKEMGFNGARKHQKVEDPRFLYWADRMGFLVSGEMANAYLFDDQYVGRFTREWMEAVERDYNHPSIVMWVPINESWGTPNPRDPAAGEPPQGALHADAIARRHAARHRQRRLGAHGHDRPVRDSRLRAVGRHDLREVQGPGHAGRRRPRQRAQGAHPRVRVQRHAHLPLRVRRHRVHPAGAPGAEGSVGIFRRRENAGGRAVTAARIV
jgi:beta-galactosidase/beta-glucuronidase